MGSPEAPDEFHESEAQDGSEFPLATDRRTCVIIVAIVGAMMLCAALPRITAFQSVMHQPLENDAALFYSLAREPVIPWRAAEREPFFVMLHRAALVAAGGERWAIRIQSAVCSVLLVGVATYIGTRVFRRQWLALIPGAFLAFTPFLIYQSTRGLRFELFLTLTGALAALLFIHRNNSTWGKYVAAGLIVGAMALTRHVGIFMAAGIFGMAALRVWRTAKRQEVLVRLAVSGGIALLLAAPFYINQARAYGSPFAIANDHARFWRNQEFRDTPGRPTTAHVRENPHTGDPTTPGEYMLGMHGLTGAVSQIARGYVRLVTFYYPHALQAFWPLLVLAIPGVVWLIWTGAWEWPALFMLVMFPFAFILPLSVVDHNSIDGRFAMHGYPFLVLLIGAGFDGVLTGAERILQRTGNEHHAPG